MKHYVLAVNGTMEMVEVKKEVWHDLMNRARKYATIEKHTTIMECCGGIVETFVYGTRIVGAIIEERSEKEC